MAPRDRDTGTQTNKEYAQSQNTISKAFSCLYLSERIAKLEMTQYKRLILYSHSSLLSFSLLSFSLLTLLLYSHPSLFSLSLLALLSTALLLYSHSFSALSFSTRTPSLLSLSLLALLPYSHSFSTSTYSLYSLLL